MTEDKTWMKFEDAILNEISQIQRNKYSSDSTHRRHLELSHSQRQKVGGLPGAGRGGGAGKLFNGYSVSGRFEGAGGQSHNNVNVPGTVELCT